MAALRAVEVAARLGLTRARISQLLAEGRLEGTYQGEGRERRYDLASVAERLNVELHPGQALGNGRETKRAVADILAGRVDPGPEPEAPRESAELPRGDLDRYELARVQKVEEEARRLRRQNAEAEGKMVLASSVALQVQRQIGQEVAEFETVLRDAARIAADRLEIDFKVLRQILTDEWRAHRARRTKALVETADAAELTEAEAEADI